jgi:hypothetical protein
MRTAARKVRKSTSVKWLLRSALAALALAGCSGSGASVPAVSDYTEARDAGAVEPDEPVAPVETDGSQTRFVCQTAQPFYDREIHEIRFALHDDELEGAIAVSPEGSLLARLDEGTVIVTVNGKLTIRGADRTELSLFDNSDRTKGFVRAGGHYAEIFCNKD